MSSKLRFQKMVDTSKDELLLGQLTAASQYHAHSKQVSACISNIVTMLWHLLPLRYYMKTAMSIIIKLSE